MPELGATRLVKVSALKPCPEIQAGPGHVVLSTFAHPATHEILDVTIGQCDDAETIGVTETHPFWSVQDQAFVPVGHLVAGSQVLTADEQTKTITSILPRPGPAQQVYNLEVKGEHAYHIGQQHLLVHNESCLKIVGLGKRPYYHELPPNAKLAINDGWTKAKLTSYASDSDDFVLAFKETLNNADEIVFSLRGVNPREAGLITGSNPLTSLSMDSIVKNGCITEWELAQILKNPSWFAKTKFIVGEIEFAGSTQPSKLIDFLIETARNY